MEAARLLYDAVKEAVVQVRAAGATGEDLISRLIRAGTKAASWTTMRSRPSCARCCSAAGETTTRTFGSLLVLLLERPELFERVRNDRALVGKAIDEAVRFEPVATFKVRQAARDLEIDGVKIPKGAMVQAIVMSANRDEEAFENANRQVRHRPQAQALVRLGFRPAHA